MGYGKNNNTQAPCLKQQGQMIKFQEQDYNEKYVQMVQMVYLGEASRLESVRASPTSDNACQ